MIRHKSTAVLANGGYSRRFEIAKPFRFLVRLAVACDAAKIDYGVSWAIGSGPSPQTRATITITADKIPVAKPLPKAPPLRAIADWKPRFHEAEYKLEAYRTEKAWQPGFVITHSSGLSLVCPSSTGEWSADVYGDADPTGKNWRVEHTLSGQGFGVELTLARAAKALLLAASSDVDWTQPVEILRALPSFQRAGKTVVAEFGNKSYHRENAKRDLERMAA